MTAVESNALMGGAEYDIESLRTVGDKHLPRIADALAAAAGEVMATSAEWERPFIEGSSFDTGGNLTLRDRVLADGAEGWVDGCVALRRLFDEATWRIRDAASAVIGVADAYADAEADAIAAIPESALGFVPEESEGR